MQYRSAVIFALTSMSPNVFVCLYLCLPCLYFCLFAFLSVSPFVFLYLSLYRCFMDSFSLSVSTLFCLDREIRNLGRALISACELIIILVIGHFSICLWLLYYTKLEDLYFALMLNLILVILKNFLPYLCLIFSFNVL